MGDRFRDARRRSDRGDVGRLITERGEAFCGRGKPGTQGAGHDATCLALSRGRSAHVAGARSASALDRQHAAGADPQRRVGKLGVRLPSLP